MLGWVHQGYKCRTWEGDPAAQFFILIAAVAVLGSSHQFGALHLLCRAKPWQIDAPIDMAFPCGAVAVWKQGNEVPACTASQRFSSGSPQWQDGG